MEFENEIREDEMIREGNFAFNERTIRHGFLRKVFTILSMQLLWNAFVIVCFMAVPGVPRYIRSQEGFWVTGVSSFGIVAFLIMMAFFEEARRSWPTNIICLTGFTAMYSVLVESAASLFEPTGVLTVMGMTALMTIGLTLYALQTKYDFTTFRAILFLLALAFLGEYFVVLFFPAQKIIFGFATVGAAVCGFYIIYDIQSMLGGQHKYAISPEDYIFAALNLYVDIVELFLHNLLIFGTPKRNDKKDK